MALRTRVWSASKIVVLISALAGTYVLFAAASMHADPAACVVIEDSVPGVQAAVAAGMRVIGFTGGGHCRPGHAERLLAAGAAAIAEDMRRLPALVSPA